jgi:hypothetical protein
MELLDGALDRLGSGGIRIQAVFQTRCEQADSDVIQRGPRRRQLLDDLRAIALLAQHPLKALDLSLDATEPSEDAVLLTLAQLKLKVHAHALDLDAGRVGAYVYHVRV